MRIIEKIKEKRKYETIMKDFAEGKMACEQFWNLYLSDTGLQHIILNDKTRFKKYAKRVIEENSDGTHKIVYKPKDSIGDYALENFPNIININDLLDRVEIYGMVYRYFERRKVKLNFNNPDNDLWKRIISLIPDWLLMVDSAYFVKLYFEAPKTFDPDKRDELFIKRLEELFRYEKVPPEWIHNADWPIVDGLPLVFKKQVDRIKDSEDGVQMTFSEYYFYDSKTHNEVKIEQFDYL